MIVRVIRSNRECRIERESRKKKKKKKRLNNMIRIRMDHSIII